MNTGQIIKSKSTERFTVIPNGILEDGRLSLKAIGLLCYILRLPADWIINKSRMHEKMKDGRDLVLNAFNELLAAGYIEQTEVRDAGKFCGFNYIVYDKPLENPQVLKRKQRKPKPENPVTEPKTEKPVTEKPKSENPELLKTNLTKDFSLSSTNVDNKGAGVLFSDTNRQEPKAKGGPAPKKPATTYQAFIDVYSVWFKNISDGTPPKIDGAQGAAAKSLIAYFKQIVKSRSEIDKVVLNETELEEKTLDAWELVLNNWHVLDTFLQDKTRLVDINSNIQNIIKSIKTHSANGNHKKRGNAKIDGSGIANMFDAVSSKYKNQSGGN